MHKKYAKDGLAAISVSVDPVEPGTEERILKFLRAREATFTNLWLDEPLDVWGQKLHTDAVPCIFVFNREFKWRQFTGEINHEEIEKYVVEQLKGK